MQCDIDDENEVQEITVVINPMKMKKKNISRKSTLSHKEIIVAKYLE